VIRIAAVGDIHLGADSEPTLGHPWARVAVDADVLLVAGDLTKCGTVAEARLVVDELADVDVPVVVVLGNHDLHADEDEALVGVLRDGGITVLDGQAVVLDLPAGRLGVAGTKGFGGGFAGSNVSAFGEPEMKAFVRHGEAVAARFALALADLDERTCDARVALLHYSPTVDTIVGERPEIHAFLGSQLLGEAIDGARVDLALHGHAHAGTEHGCTSGGTPVRNVAMPVIGCAYRVYELGQRSGRRNDRLDATAP
jgi:Icc-related predicted phosphoesterase